MRLSGGVIAALILLLWVAFAGCGSSKVIEKSEPPLPNQLFYTLEDTLEIDTDLNVWMKPLRDQHRERMGRPIAVVKVPIHYSKPESRMGNLTADMVRSRATHELQQPVHVSLLDEGRFAMEWSEGEITRADLYDWMPHNDALVILELAGAALRRLADEIAQEGGVPISGLRMVIGDEGARGVLIRSETVQDESVYRIATTNALIRSGRFHSLDEALSRTDYPLLIRDMMADYVRGRQELEPELDRRIRRE